jgi:hypothetical protein
MFLLSVVPSCGAGGAPEAKSPDTEAEEPKADVETQAVSETEGADAEAPETTQPAGSCADGSCFACGSGFCPAGFYCDESASGGPGCGWLPTCAPKATCACVELVLSDCSCKESDGATHVTCD